MIALSESTDKAAIDRAIARALARIEQRAAPYGDTAQSWTSAISRATAGGKRFRPYLVAASFDAFGGSAEAAPMLAAVAASFELLHTAFVVHDDVIDHDFVRRGSLNIAGTMTARAEASGVSQSAASSFGTAAAILAGDLLLHEAFRCIACSGVPADQEELLLALLDDAIFISAVGELADVENAMTTSPAPTEALIATAHNKTAVYSFSGPLQAGAVLAQAEPDTIVVVGAVASKLGLAFQLVDDLIGAFGTSEQAGREPGADLREAKQTALIALARDSAQWPRVNDALHQAHTGAIAVQEAQRAIDDSGARERLLALIYDTLAQSRAEQLAARLPTPVSALLDEISDAIEERIP